MSYLNYSDKIRAADAYYKEWEKLFKCKINEEYYEGRQWRQKGVYTTEYYQPYSLNLIYSAIEQKLASLLVRGIGFSVSPMPGYADWDTDFAYESALTKADFLNTLVQNPNANFEAYLKLVAIDSFLRFGVGEVNYAADFENPRKKPIITTEFTDEYVEAENARKLSEIQLPEKERIFFKHIKASRFRVSTSDDTLLTNCSWCGYYSFVYESVLRKTSGIQFPENYVGMKSKDYRSSDVRLNKNALQSGDVCKIIKIWDNEQNKKLIFLDGYYDEPIKETSFDNLPFETNSWIFRAPSNEEAGFYPIPPVYNWLSPQDEINQAREQMRNFRRRYTRKFTYIENQIDTEELDKFKNESDGEMIAIKRPDVIKAVENPSIGATITGDLQVSNDDFNKVAAVSQVQESDRTTATQSKINAVRETVRQDMQKIDFSQYVGRVGRKMLLVAQERVAVGMWIAFSADPSLNLMEEVQEKGPVYKWISSQQIDDGYDCTVSVEPVQLTPEDMQTEQTNFITFLKILQAFPFIAMSPTLIIETAFKCNYRNLKVIRQMQQMAQLQMMAQVQQGQQALGQGNSPEAQGMGPNANPNSQSEIDTQLQSQV